ncbi:MAG: hypothetical protein PHO78_07920 [Methanomicrobium sp.]|nr:hypothetical protein [Methanomicrobium sp.]
MALLGAIFVPAVSAESDTQYQNQIPVKIKVESALQDASFIISDEIKTVTSHWVLFAADEEGQKNAINDLNEVDLPAEEKLELINDLQAIWKKYPVVTKSRGEVTEVVLANSNDFSLTDDENSTLSKVDEVLSKYLNDQYMDENGVRWYAAPEHQDMIEISCLKWGVSSTYATYAHNAADDPDSWPSIYPPTGFEWLDNFIEDICHSYDHYYNPVLGTGNAPSQCENYADIAKDYYDQSSMYNAYTNLGYSSHFITDVGNPLHTGMETNQITNSWVHFEYEDYVNNNWEDGSGQDYYFKSVIEDNWYYYAITDPSGSTFSLADYSHDSADTLYYLVYNHRYTFETDSDVRSITENCLLDTAKYTLGLVKYTRD